MDKWIFLIKVKNRPGVLSAMTALFADRGVSLDSLTAHDSSGVGTPYGTAILTFHATPGKKDHLKRLLTRLEAVQEVQEFLYSDTDHARKSALARVSLPAETLKEALPEGIFCDIVTATEMDTLALLLGPPTLLDQALTDLATSGVLLAMDSTVIVV